MNGYSTLRNAIVLIALALCTPSILSEGDGDDYKPVTQEPPVHVEHNGSEPHQDQPSQQPTGNIPEQHAGTTVPVQQLPAKPQNGGESSSSAQAQMDLERALSTKRQQASLQDILATIEHHVKQGANPVQKITDPTLLEAADAIALDLRRKFSLSIESTPEKTLFVSLNKKLQNHSLTAIDFLGLQTLANPSSTNENYLDALLSFGLLYAQKKSDIMELVKQGALPAFIRLLNLYKFELAFKKISQEKCTFVAQALDSLNVAPGPDGKIYAQAIICLTDNPQTILKYLGYLDIQDAVQIKKISLIIDDKALFNILSPYIQALGSIAEKILQITIDIDRNTSISITSSINPVLLAQIVYICREAQSAFTTQNEEKLAVLLNIVSGLDTSIKQALIRVKTREKPEYTIQVRAFV